MAVTQNTYTGNGSTVLYSFTFPYLEESDIKVSLNGTLTTAYTLANATTVQFNTAPTNGAAVRIYRETAVEDLQATFFSGSAIRAQDLNDNFLQSNYSNQEVKDRFLDRTGGTLTGTLNAGGFKITNVGTPTDNADASTKAYVDSTIGTAGSFAAQAGASAAAASTSASNASTSATNSANSATASATSAAASLASQTASAASASAASTSASNASTSASNASTSATNAASSATASANSATSAASSAASALAAFDSFDDRYLGDKATDPSVDNDGDPLTAGDLYWNTTLSVMKVYTGSAWLIAYVPGAAANISFSPYGSVASNNVQGAVQELVDEKLNLTGGTMSGNITFNGGQSFPNTVVLSGTNGSAVVPNGTTAQRDASPATGYFRYNTTLTQFEGYNGSAWGAIGGGATGGTGNAAFYENDSSITANYTITAGRNAMSTGPVTVANGVVITVPTNSSWVVL